MTQTLTHVQTPEAVLQRGKTFVELGLSPQALQAVERIGFKTPTEIQEKFIPAALTGRDCIGQAKTGTGKTAAFLLPIFQRHYSGRGVKALILAPTRELAAQITDMPAKLAGAAGPQAIVMYGGTSFHRQVQQLRKNPQIVVATPGRLLDHVRQRTLRLNDFSIVVLDEVDRMFDLGFRKDISAILSQCSGRDQTLFLSATLPQDILSIGERYLRNPVRICTVSEEAPSVESVEQCYFSVAQSLKLPLLVAVLKREQPSLALIFTRTKRGAERLGKALEQRNIDSMHIHGGLTQSRREQVILHFRQRKVKVLVATDVMGRGIDVPGISHVINYDIPERPEDYLHRIGRSGRMNAVGKAMTFVTPEQGKEITAIEYHCNRLLDKDQIEGFDNGIPQRTPRHAAPRPTTSRQSFRRKAYS